MKYALATLMILITALVFGGCAASDSSAPLPNFNFNFDEEKIEIIKVFQNELDNQPEFFVCNNDQSIFVIATENKII